MEHRTRCAWIQQSDIDRLDREPFLCGAAAAQMILYGRDDAKNHPGDNGTLVDSDARLKTDQQSVWKAIKDRSQRMTLPEGARYDGEPEWEQVREAITWTTFPHALASTITKGVAVDSGPVAGV